VRTPARWAVAVRRPDGEMHIESHPIAPRWTRLRKTFLRGPLAVAESISIGLEGIRIAVRTTSGVEATQRQTTVSFVPIAIGIVVVLVVAPSVLSLRASDLTSDIVEASVRAATLLTYLVVVSRTALARRLFGYHGAEHMAIAAFERLGRVPTTEEVQASSPVHVRCGTNFLALFVIVCGVAFSFAPREPIWQVPLVRVLGAPVLAAVAYELMRLAASRPAALWSRAVTWPGRTLQRRFTTRQPEAGQREVALRALEAAIEG
jgi:uncharacterized protein YqhQ